MHRTRPERGAAAVEFAMVFVLLVTILVGIMEGARMWYIQANLSQAAREGARYMAIHNEPGEAVAIIVDRAAGLGVAPSGSVAPTDCAAGETVEARASAQVTSMTGLLDFAIPESGITVTGKADMRCGG